MSARQRFLCSMDSSVRIWFLLTESVLVGVITTWFLACLFLNVAPAGELFGGFTVMLGGAVSLPYLVVKKQRQRERCKS